MTSTKIIYALVIICLTFSCRNTTKRKSNEIKTTQALSTSKYDSVRNSLLNITPKDLGITIPEKEIIIYGVITEWKIGSGDSVFTTTLCAYINGNLCYLTGTEKEIGNFKVTTQIQLAIEFITEARTHLDKSEIIATTDIPSKDEFYTYLLTNHGRYLLKVKSEGYNHSNEWEKLNDLRSYVLYKAMTNDTIPR